MTFASLFNDLQICCLFLLAGYVIRELCPVFRKIFLPSSVIGGVIALIGGQQVLSLWEVPQVFSSFSGTLMVLIMTCLIWGVSLDMNRLKNYVDFTCFTEVIRFGQIGIGALTGILLRYVWKGLPQGWGTMGVSAYFGGHGSAGSYATVFEDLGYGTDYMSIGMVMATMGLICAVIIGMIIVNYGVRKGWATYVKVGQQGTQIDEHGAVPEDQQTSIGVTKVFGGSINNLVFQFAMLMLCIWFGRTLFGLLGQYVWAGFNKLPTMSLGIFGAVILWPIMKKLKLSGYVDRKTCSTISGFAMDLLIVSAIATLNLKVLTEFWLPILIHFLVIAIFTAFVCLWYNPRISSHEWFEKSMYAFGTFTGTAACGLALVRSVDPDSVATPGEAAAIQNSSTGLIFAFLPAILPVLATSLPWVEVGIGIGASAAFAIVGWVLFRKTVKGKCGR